MFKNTVESKLKLQMAFNFAVLALFASTVYFRNAEIDYLENGIYKNSSNVNDVRNQLREQNELVNNLESYIVSKKAAAEKTKIMVGSNVFLENGTVCNVNEHTDFSEFYNCKSVVLLNAKNRLLDPEAAPKYKYAPHPTNITFVADGFTNSVTE